MEILRFTIEQTLLGQRIVSALHYAADGVTPQTAQAHVDYIRDAYVEHVQLLVNDWSTTRVVVGFADEFPFIGLPILYQLGPLTGENADAPLPSLLAVMSSVVAPVLFYPREARLFQGGFPVTAVSATGGVIPTILSLVGVLTDALNQLKPDGETPLQRVAVTRNLSGTVTASQRLTGVVASVRTEWSAVQRRKAGRGQ